MKKNKHITFLGIITTLLITWGATSALAGYYSFGVGNGGKAEKKSLSLEVGSRNFKMKNEPFLVAVCMPLIDHGDDNIPLETNPDACPNDDYTSLGKIPEGIETGLLFKMGKRWNHSNTYFSLLGGVTQVNEIRLTQSNTNPDLYYTQSSEKKLKGVGGISVGYFPEILDWKLKLTIQIDYDNRRGVTGSIGWCW